VTFHIKNSSKHKHLLTFRLYQRPKRRQCKNNLVCFGKLLI